MFGGKNKQIRNKTMKLQEAKVAGEGRRHPSLAATINKGG